jgi:hypothetical protein
LHFARWQANPETYNPADVRDDAVKPLAFTDALTVEYLNFCAAVETAGGRGNSVEHLEQLGYTGNESRSPPIRNTRNGLLYHLVYFSKAGKGDAIWDSVAKRTASGQGSML